MFKEMLCKRAVMPTVCVNVGPKNFVLRRPTVIWPLYAKFTKLN